MIQIFSQARRTTASSIVVILATLWLAVLMAASAISARPGGAVLAADALPTIRIAILKFGSVNWQLDTARHHGLDRKHGVRLKITGLASTQAVKTALESNSVDLIVADWVWVARRRGRGAGFTFRPYSTAVGGLMVRRGSSIRSVADLKGKHIGVAGGPLDKNWLFLKALALKDHGLDLNSGATAAYGAPPLLAKKAEQGELDAVLNYWHYCARLEAKGFRQIVGIAAVMKALGAQTDMPAIGYVFRDSWAAGNAAALDGFFAAIDEANAILARSDAEWTRLRPLLRAGNDLTFSRLKARYRAGIPAFGPLSTAKWSTAARALFRILAGEGGRALVGELKDLPKGTFWQPK